MPLLPFSTVSTVNVPLFVLPSQTNVLRWLSHQPDAVFDDSGLVSLALDAPDAISLAETQTVWPEGHE
jgi:hypothetical protein